MEPDEVLEGESRLGQLINILKRTPKSIADSGTGGEEFESVEHENLEIKSNFDSQHMKNNHRRFWPQKDR